MKPTPGQITAFAQLPDADGDWHLIAQVRQPDDKVTHGTLHVDPTPRADAQGFSVQFEPVPVDAQIVNAAAAAQRGAGS